MHLFILYGHADDLPTHGFLINLLHKAEQKSEIKNANLSAILLADFKLFYPHIQIGRADRFLDTVRRIATPTMGPNKITGSSLRSYLKRTWTPRIRNQNGIPCTYTHEHACTIIKMTYSYTDIYLILIIISTAATYSQFPAYLHEYGLCEDVLLTTFEQTKQPNSTFLSWSLCQHPTVNFYIHLHNFLKLCSVTKNETKATIGKFYNAIDKKMMRPDNDIYQLVENRVKYTKNTTTLMNYSFSRKSITTSVSTLADGYSRKQVHFEFCDSVWTDLTVLPVLQLYVKPDHILLGCIFLILSMLYLFCDFEVLLLWFVTVVSKD